MNCHPDCIGTANVRPALEANLRNKLAGDPRGANEDRNTVAVDVVISSTCSVWEFLMK